MTPRWRSAIAIIAALSVFVALVAGSSLRPRLAASTLPEPAAWTHVTHHLPAHVGQRPDIAAARSHSQPGHRLGTGVAPTKNKTFLSMWMPRAVPTNWTALSPHSDWLALPASFAAPASAPGAAAGAASAATPANRDTPTLLCILRC
ncbi:hypothetical protein MSEO_44350 [Mycobacterium seoulense]|uniref:Uncharacterized protein n=1 Tax=Mycobacterium seoulense TaxID=386911 RepID=A0A7I7P4Z6_9MYCO|nr:hypothetical protein MSEO_44350 [Mycobacterium seoulense]